MTATTGTLRHLTLLGRFRTQQMRQQFAAMTVFLMRGTAAVLSYVMFALIGRRCSAAEYGVFALVFALTGFFGPVAAAAQDSIAYRYIPASRHQVREIARFNLRFLLFGIPIACLAGILLLRSSLGPTALSVAPLLAGSIAVSGLNEYLFAVERASGPVLGAIFAKELLWRLVFIALIVASLYFDAPRLSSKTVASLYLFSLLPSLLAFLCSFAAQLRSSPSSSAPEEVAPFRVRPSQVGSFFGITCLNMASVHLDTLILGLAHGAELAAFFSAQRSTQILNFFSYSFGVVAAPAISLAYARGDITAIERRSRQAAIVAGGCVLVFAGLMMAAAPEVMAIFNPSFRADGYLLRILCIAPILSTFCGLHSWIPVLCGLEKEYLLGRCLLAGVFTLPKIVAAACGDITVFAALVVGEQAAVAVMGATLCAWKGRIRVV